MLGRRIIRVVHATTHRIKILRVLPDVCLLSFMLEWGFIKAESNACDPEIRKLWPFRSCGTPVSISPIQRSQWPRRMRTVVQQHLEGHGFPTQLYIDSVMHRLETSEWIPTGQTF